MRAKAIIGLLAAVLVAGGIAGTVFWYQQDRSRAGQKTDLGTITFGWNQWVGVLPYLVAYEKGFFRDQGLNLVLKEEPSYSQIFIDLKSNKIDFAGALALIDIMQDAATDNRLQVVGVTDFSNGADGIAAEAEIKTLKELKGKKIAVEKGTLGEYLLFAALERENLTLDDVAEENYAGAAGAAVFQEEKVDAVVAYEPFLTAALARAGSYKIFSSADEPGLIIDTIAFPRQAVQEKPAQVAAVLRAYLRGLDFVQQEPEAAYEIGARYFKLAPAELQQQAKGIKWAGLRENVAAFSHGGGYTSLYNSGRNRNFFLKKIGKIETDIDLDKILAPEFIRRINLQP